MTQQFTVTLDDKQVATLRKLADHWGITPQEALYKAAVDGIDGTLEIIAGRMIEVALDENPYSYAHYRQMLSEGKQSTGS